MKMSISLNAVSLVSNLVAAQRFPKRSRGVFAPLAMAAWVGLGGWGMAQLGEPGLIQVERPNKAGYVSVTLQQMLEARDMQSNPPLRDPSEMEAYQLRLQVRKEFNARQFDELERIAADFHSTKRVLPTGGWAIAQFYEAFKLRSNEQDSMWKLHEEIYQAWMTAKPESISARVAYANYLVSYAWAARGGGYADSVSKDGWKLFGERIAASRAVLEKSLKLKEKDPVWWRVMLIIARAEGWNRATYDALADSAHAAEPKFWGCDTERACSLLPRWHGEPGEWEAFAEKAAARPDGLGAEIYARIIMDMSGYYRDVFKETKASWPKTREGLEKIIASYPNSLTTLHHAAYFARQTGDQAFAKTLFEKIDSRYMASMWEMPEDFVRTRDWAKTGKWPEDMVPKVAR